MKPRLLIEYEDYEPTRFTVSSSTCPLNGTLTFTVTAGDPEVATYSLSYYLDEDKEAGFITQNKNISNSQSSFSPPYSWKSLFDGNTATLTVSLRTYNSSGNQVGTYAVAYITLTIPKANPPTIDSAYFSDESNVYSLFGVYVQGHSQMKMTISASADTEAGAYISSYSTTVNGSTYGGSSFGIGSVGSTSLSARITVTDSEGQTASGTYSCSLASYTPPSVSGVRSGRCDSSGNDKQDGTYMKMSFTVKSTQVGNKRANNVSYQIMYKQSTSSSWITYKTVDTGSTSAKVTDLVLTGVTFATDKSYDLKVVASDYFQTSEVQEDVGTKEVLINLMKGGKGIAFGKLSQIEGAIELGWPAVFNERADSATSLLYLGRNAVTNDTVTNWVTKGFCYAYYDSKYLDNQPTNSGFILSMPYCMSTTQVASSATMIAQLWIGAGEEASVSKRYGNSGGFGAWNDVGGVATLKKVYPVGSIYVSTSSTNPADLFGFGTWVQFAKGRMLMGAGGGYFGEGGAAEVTLTTNQIPSHSHTPGTNIVSDEGNPDLFLTGVNGGASRQKASVSTSSNARYAIMSKASTNSDLGFASTTSSVGGNAPHNNLPPYVVCYMWHRTE